MVHQLRFADLAIRSTAGFDADGWLRVDSRRVAQVDGFGLREVHWTWSGHRALETDWPLSAPIGVESCLLMHYLDPRLGWREADVTPR